MPDAEKRKGRLTNDDLCALWQIQHRSVRKECKRWGLRPVDWDGLVPLFDLADVERATVKRK